MTRRTAATFGAFGVLLALAAVVALTAQAGTRAHGTATPAALLHGVDDDGIHGAVSFVSTPAPGGTAAAVIVHGLPAEARVDVRLHTGRSLERASASSTALPSGHAATNGSFRAYGAVRSRNGSDVALSDITDGAHLVLLYAGDELVAYAHIPRS